MPIVFLTHWTQKISTPGDQAFLGITMMLVGISLVLTILVLISIFVSIMSKIINKEKKTKSDNNDPKAKLVEKTKIQEQALLQTTDKISANVQDPAIIAVIAAAVHTMLSKDNRIKSKAGFTIRRIRRV